MDRQLQIDTLAGDGSLKELKELLEPNSTQFELDSALTNAVAYSQLHVAEYLLELGAKIENLNYEGVYSAVHNNELEGLKFSVAHGIDVNVLNGSLINTSIETSTNTGDSQILKWLLSNGADPKLITRHSKYIAKRYGTYELQELIKGNTNKNLKVIVAYIIGILCLTLFFVMDNSTELNEFLGKVERSRADWAFGTFAITGFIQYGLLTIGIAVITILTALLINRKITT